MSEIETIITWPSAWSIERDSYDSENEFVKALTNKFQEVRQAYQKSQANLNHLVTGLPDLLNLILAESWYPDFKFSIDDSIKLESASTSENFGIIESKLITYFRANSNEIKKRLFENYPERASILGDAFEAFDQKKYSLAIPVFLAQADGISYGFLSCSFFMYRNSKIKAKDLINKARVTRYASLLLDPLVQLGTARENTSKLIGKTDYLNRHGILHGSDLDYPSEKNALKAISLLAYVTSVNLYYQDLQQKEEEANP